jgi:hypothetical protein
MTATRGRAILAALLLAALLALATPWLLWASSLSAAGALLERGMAWPEPRHADALPQLRDEPSLRAAEGQLEQARRWRADHPHAYRLAGQIAMARADWAAAAAWLDQAHARAPRDPLIAWEAGLAYEQIALASPQDAAALQRMRERWRAAGFGAEAFSARAAEARAAGRAAEAARWERRAAP